MALRERPVGLSGHIMSISGRLTGMGMHGTRPLVEQLESLLLGGFMSPLKLDVELLAGRPAPWRVSGEDEALEDEDSCLCGCLTCRSLGEASLMVTDLTTFDMIFRDLLSKSLSKDKLAINRLNS